MRKYFLILLIVAWSNIFPLQHAAAAEPFVILNVTKYATFTLRPSASLSTVMTAVEERIYARNITKRGSLGLIRVAPAGLASILADTNERILVRNIEKRGVLALSPPPSTLLSELQNTAARFIMTNIEMVGWFTLPRLILDHGVPTATIMPAAAPPVVHFTDETPVRTITPLTPSHETPVATPSAEPFTE